jgi:hypothetical protein
VVDGAASPETLAAVQTKSVPLKLSPKPLPVASPGESSTKV